MGGVISELAVVLQTGLLSSAWMLGPVSPAFPMAVSVWEGTLTGPGSVGLPLAPADPS